MSVLREAGGPGTAIDDWSLTPTDGFERLASGAAPLQLLPPPVTPLERDTLLVRAAGYERAKLVIDWTGGGERTLELRPAGGLDLDLEGAPAEMQFRVRLHSIDAVAEEAKLLRQRIERAQRLGADMTTGPWDRMVRRLRDQDRFVADVDPWKPSREVERTLYSITTHRSASAASFTLCRVDDLATGRWAVALYDLPQDRAKLPTLHAYRRFDIVAGRRASLTLDDAPLPPPSAPARVEFHGRVRFDRGWLAPGMGSLPDRVTFRALAPPADRLHPWGVTSRLDDGATADEKLFGGVALPPGPAVATFGDWPYRVRFAVPEPLEGGSEPPEVELAIPPPMELTVRATRRDGDLAIVPADFDVIAASEPAALAGGSGEKRSNDGAPLLLRLPAGHWRIRARSDEHASWPTTVDRHVDRSGESIDLALRESAFVELEYRDGEAIVPIESESLLRSHLRGAALGEGIVGSLGAVHESTATLVIDGEGAALLHLEEPPGYAPIAPVEVELVRGATVRVSVALERLRR
ncbi:MAG: hypothetical protein JNL90_00595 [Planctomycetes bacterium]|nr:hypothetical protein [Planctomycetota bacterium]